MLIKKTCICLLRLMSHNLSAYFASLQVQFNDRGHCFSMQVVINKCFLLNPEKNLAQIRLVVFEINAPLIPKNDVTEPKARLLYLPVKKLLTS